MINGTWCNDSEKIKHEVFKCLANKFKEKWPSRPKLNNNHFKRITPADSQMLEEPISLEEIKAAVWACGNEKAPGPDRYSFKFIKKYWDVLLGDYWSGQILCGLWETR